jgi:hypothetical protein
VLVARQRQELFGGGFRARDRSRCALADSKTSRRICIDSLKSVAVPGLFGR